jgi:hypothetical protein
VTINKQRWLHAAGWISLTLFCTMVFYSNILATTSEMQFRTYRDGSEALVLGKVYADSVGLPTGPANLGFIEKQKLTKSADVLAVYARVDHPGAVVATDLTDANWQHGSSTYDSALLLQRTDVAQLGYASNEVAPGQRLHFHNGVTRTVSKVESSPRFLTVHYDGPKILPTGIGLPQPIVLTGEQNLMFDPYLSQYGLQGMAFSWLHKTVSGFSTVASMQLLAAILCATVLVLLTREYQSALGSLFGAVFLLCMIGSPWVVAVARNLYWLAFLWFLPALMAMYLYRSVPASPKRKLIYFLFFLSIFVKSLTGYEYLSTVVVLASAIFFVAPFLASPTYTWRSALRVLIMLGLLSVAGFIAALLMHASLRAYTVLGGLKVTIVNAFEYTKLASAGNSPGMQDALVTVLGTYIFNWGTPLLFWIPGRFVFFGLMVTTVGALLYQYAVNNPDRHRDSALVFAMAIAPLSWLILMKGHSVIHVHLNYVLWYLGCIPAMLYVSIRSASLAMRNEVP